MAYDLIKYQLFYRAKCLCYGKLDRIQPDFVFIVYMPPF
jgi:hypothetical protein